jgi:hypothetical protein
MGVGYDFASGSAVKFLARSTDGRYLNRPLPSSDMYDDSFKQTESELSLKWSIDGKSSAELRAMVLKRSHPNYPQRDYHGVNAAAGLNIGITGKTSLALNWTRELNSYQTNTTNFTQFDRLSLGPTWQIGPKTRIRLHHEIGRRDFLGTPTTLASNTPPRSDITHDTVLSLEWQPYSFVIFTIALQDALRRSNQAGLDYQSYLANVSAQFIY